MIFSICANPAIDRVYFVENYEPGKVNRPLEFTVSAGGKGVNVAKVVSALGENVLITGFLGGYNGKFIENQLKNLNIPMDFVFTESETRTCINLTDRNGVSGEILEGGGAVTPEDKEKFFDIFKNNIKKADIVTISGSLPEGLTEEFYVTLLNIAKENNRKSIVDASGKVLRNVIDANPFMIKPNRFELSEYFGKEMKTYNELKWALLTLRDKGVEMPFCTLGGDGAVLLHKNEFIHFVTPKINPVNTVGSGDSTLAGIAVGLSRNYDIINCVKLGMACGLTNATFRETGIVSKEKVNDFLPKIKIETI